MENNIRKRSLLLRRRLTRLAVALLAIVSFAACSGKTEPGADSSDQKVFGTLKSGMSLTNASATMTQTSDTRWTLSKTGTVDTVASAVTWSITATQTATVSGQLVIFGQVTLMNSGAGPATLGNVVLNLQTKSGSNWVTQSSDIADATHGDAATTAQIDPHASSEGLSTFTENSASGHLLFINANTNTTFSLVPEVSIAPGANLTLLFSAGFDNTVLNLPDGTSTRAEAIFSFGNAAPSKASSPNVDINGNGTIDPDEAWVLSLPARIGLTVPPQASASNAVTLSDTISDITTSGTVTFSNAMFNLGATSGTVSANVSGGASGGTITNCAHLTSSQTTTINGTPFPNANSISLKSCSTLTITSSATCSPGTIGCPWKNGDVITYSQGDWGGDPSSNAGAALLVSDFGTVYAATLGVVTVGLTSGGFSMSFTDSNNVLAYLPASGTAAALDANLDNPTSTSSGVFGGDVLALQLNVDFSDAGFLVGNSGLKFGNLTVCNLTSDIDLNGMTIRQILNTANTALGGGSVTDSISDLDFIVATLNNSFFGGSPSTWAQQHLVNGSCGWQTGQMITYTQGFWSDDATAAGILTADYDSVYGSTFGVVEVGIPGSSGFSMRFSDSSFVLAYLPASGTATALDADVVNPSTTSSGVFGGDVLALQFNIDFSDAGFLVGTSGLKFGDLTLCNLTSDTDLNGMTVRQVLGVVSTALGGGIVTDSISDLDALAANLNASFGGGSVTTFAQQHLFPGACP